MRHLLLVSLAIPIGLLPQRARAQRSVPTWTLVETLRIDANTEDFSELRLARDGNTPFYVGPNREIVIPFAQDANIRVYDSTGKRLATVGRRGSGPGEFRNIFRLGWTRDSLWTYDALQRRMSYFDSKFAHGRTTVLSEVLRQPPDGPDPHVISDFAPSAVARDGSLLGQILVVNGRATDGWLLYKYFVASVAADNTVKQLAEIPPQAVSPRAYLKIEPTPGFVYATVPFANDAIYSVAPAGDRFAIVTTDHAAHTFRLTMFNAAGGTQFAKAFPYQARPLSKAVVDSAVTAVTKNVRQSADIVAALQKRVRESVPSEYPPVASIVLARDNTAWIRVRSTAGDDTVKVVGATGDLLAAIPFKRNVDVVDADASHVWAVDVDTDGLASILVFSIRGRESRR